jgi:hypothetical protein
VVHSVRDKINFHTAPFVSHQDNDCHHPLHVLLNEMQLHAAKTQKDFKTLSYILLLPITSSKAILFWINKPIRASKNRTSLSRIKFFFD